MTTDHGAAEPAPPTSGTARKLALVLGGLILAFGLFSEDWQSLPWAGLAIVVFGLPLSLQFVRSATWRAYGLWFGLFMVAQSLLTPLLRGNYVALPAGMKTTVHVTTAGIPGYAPGTRQVTTDARGWRVQPAVDYAKKTGPRIVAIGGSTTEDIALDDRATWTHRLQQSLIAEFAGLHVVNTGVSGLRAANHAATMRMAEAVEPDLVLILLGGNDWNKHIKDHHEPDRAGWQPLPMRKTALPSVLNDMLIVPLRRQPTGSSWSDRTLTIVRPEDLSGGRRTYGERVPRQRFEPEAVSPAYAADLDALGSLCTELKRRCLFITQPHAYGPPDPPAALLARFWMTPPYADYGLELASMAHVARLYNAHLLQFARRRGHAGCDAAAGMPPEPLLFYDDMHYTDEGAVRMAELVAPCVREILMARK